MTLPRDPAQPPRRRLAVAAVLLLIFGLAAAPARASPYQQVIDAAVAQGVPAVQALVLSGGSQWSGEAGVASVESGRPLTATDRLRLASITKMFTYATIMALVAQGRLGLADRAVDRLPAGTLAGIPHGDRITIAHLLEHRSGLHNFNGAAGADFFQDLYGDPARGARRWTALELLSYARRPANPPTGPSGDAQAYSSTGYILLELIAEHVSGRPLAQLYRELIFAPLGMTRTGVEGDDLAAADIVDSYGRPPDDVSAPSAFAGRPRVRPDGLLNLSGGLTYYNAWARGAGASASTASDLARFMRAVIAGRQTVIAEQMPTFAAAAARPTASFSWNGGSAGIQSSILYAPHGDIVVIVLTNGTNSGPGSYDIGRSLLAAARAEAAAPAAERG
ncbi:MAG TPA: serine hydrolase domain-containing protein [Allosphingosinicella sp.]|nr:serine hydrolase domain-containing protein [Allosphingosinicella sp.]